ncbi:hypothetical protein FPQ18DRAFT_343110 [Pyronema domesticum]|nr:hypothetical protein FPQ18DRAFT_343110 [Pyronema domesticum]
MPSSASFMQSFSSLSIVALCPCFSSYFAPLFGHLNEQHLAIPASAGVLPVCAWIDLAALLSQLDRRLLFLSTLAVIFGFIEEFSSSKSLEQTREHPLEFCYRVLS